MTIIALPFVLGLANAFLASSQKSSTSKSPTSSIKGKGCTFMNTLKSTGLKKKKKKDLNLFKQDVEDSVWCLISSSALSIIPLSGRHASFSFSALSARNRKSWLCKIHPGLIQVGNQTMHYNLKNNHLWWLCIFKLQFFFIWFIKTFF